MAQFPHKGVDGLLSGMGPGFRLAFKGSVYRGLTGVGVLGFYRCDLLPHAPSTNSTSQPGSDKKKASSALKTNNGSHRSARFVPTADACQPKQVWEDVASAVLLCQGRIVRMYKMQNFERE